MSIKPLNACLVAAILVDAIRFHQPPKLHADYGAFKRCADYCMTQVNWDICVTVYCLKEL